MNIPKKEAKKMEENTKNTQRMGRCPSFDTCSSPKCPLDEFTDTRIRYSDEPKCVATKKTRLLLGQDLKYKGLTSQEYNAIIKHYGSLDVYLKRFLQKTPIRLKLKTLKRVGIR